MGEADTNQTVKEVNLNDGGDEKERHVARAHRESHSHSNPGRGWQGEGDRARTL